MPAATDEARRSTIRGITSRSWGRSGTRRSPIAPGTINSGAHDHGAYRGPRSDGPTQAVWNEERLRRDPRHSTQTAARATTLRGRYAQGGDFGEAGALDQVSTDHRQAAAGQGRRRLRVQRYLDQREPGARSRRWRLHRSTA